MKITLQTIRSQIDLLEMMVDNYHRSSMNGELPPCSYDYILKLAMTISYNLSNVKDGEYLTMKSPEFKKMMVIAKNIDNMTKQK